MPWDWDSRRTPTWWIRQAILRAVNSAGHAAELPEHLAGSARRLRAAQERLWQEHQRVPRPDDVARAAVLRVEDARRLESLLQEARSLDQRVGEDETLSLGDVLPNVARPIRCSRYIGRRIADACGI